MRICLLFIFLIIYNIILLCNSYISIINHNENRNNIKLYSTIKRKAITYVPIELNIKAKSSINILIRSDQSNSIELLKSFNHKKITKDNIEYINKLIESGLAFQSTDDGIRALFEAEETYLSNFKPEYEQKQSIITTNYVPRPPGNLFVNIRSNDSELFVKTSVGTTVINDIKEGKVDIQDLIENGEAFTNVTKLLIDEELVSRADSISLRLKQDFPMTSNEWDRWINKTNEYNAVTLTQVFGKYFRDESVGDLGGDGSGYVPRAGYPGTLAPGNNFIADEQIEDLPKKILHPWPAMQEFDFHVRWPPSHPMIPPPLLWIALNNMYTNNFTSTQFASTNDNEIVGGTQMTPGDAIRIARGANFGLSYVPEEQINHGGMIFPGGYEIPFYNPDHGPTYEDSKPTIPPHLMSITERWTDTTYEDELTNPDIELSDNLPKSINSDIETELQQRKLSVEKILGYIPEPIDDISQLNEEIKTNPVYITRRNKLIDSKINRFESIKDRFDNIFDNNDVIVTQEQENADNKQLDYEINELVKKDIIFEKLMDRAVTGRARANREIISYTIDIVRTMQDDIVNAERDIATRKKSGRRSRHKKKSAAASLDLEISPSDNDIEVFPETFTDFIADEIL